ncbi:hypothetical protein MSNKSG1_14012 [Marinobacter santoriniensis NKSG1]|uniref:Uncharacterized protein n=1 Tax=Marinobacter santoriniensis NKSG1 TaxID=1288826 RepID=M7DB04_9GAMM|nr:transporter substrate-binding domain-containing protein [Marinobacter santoriniensis]EMP54852.1 hypothetical protein MSNKSG1_14012 [Marinobacter santoriniensis NKSG1]
MKASRYPLLSLVLILMFSAVPAEGAQAVRIATPDISNLLTESGDGIYQRLMNRAVAGLPWQATEQFYPYKRALMVFQQGDADCIYSFTDVLRNKLGQDAVVASYPLGKFAFYIFTAKGAPAPAGLDELRGQEVGAVIGHETYLDPILSGRDLKVFWSKSDAMNLAMLKHGRFDIMIAALPDVAPLLDQLSYQPAHPLLESFDRLTCHNTRRNRAFVKALSASLKRLKSEGVYQDIAGPLYLDFKTDQAPEGVNKAGRTPD